MNRTPRFDEQRMDGRPPGFRKAMSMEDPWLIVASALVTASILIGIVELIWRRRG